jgi:hypothetical protein
MAIKQEHFEINGHDFVRTVSDSGRYVVRDGVSYEEANDPAELGRTYTEGDLMPDNERGDELAAKAEAYDILMGVSE